MDNLENMELDQLAGLDAPEGAGEFSLPEVVLREIFLQFPNADLLNNFSRVNKSWHYEALSGLRDRGPLTAQLNSADRKCKDLQNARMRAFASDLPQTKDVMKVVPFCGLTIAISGWDEDHGDWCEESEAGELDQMYEDILHQWDWKHLAVDLSYHTVRGEKSPGLQFVKKVLQNRSCSLEEFSLETLSNPEAKEFCIQNLTQDSKFSSLRN